MYSDGGYMLFKATTSESVSFAKQEKQNTVVVFTVVPCDAFSRAAIRFVDAS